MIMANPVFGLIAFLSKDKPLKNQKVKPFSKDTKVLTSVNLSSLVCFAEGEELGMMLKIVWTQIYVCIYITHQYIHAFSGAIQI